ncbi:hypothetical protein HDU76_010416, partial [Blyttiomyces sp. JEL0837]
VNVPRFSRLSGLPRPPYNLQSNITSCITNGKMGTTASPTINSFNSLNSSSSVVEPTLVEPDSLPKLPPNVLPSWRVLVGGGNSKTANGEEGDIMVVKEMVNETDQKETTKDVVGEKVVIKNGEDGVGGGEVKDKMKGLGAGDGRQAGGGR